MFASSMLLMMVVAAGSDGVDPSAPVPVDAGALDFELTSITLDETLRFGFLQDEVEAETAPIEEYERLPHFGAQGSRRWNIHGGIGVDLSNDANTLGLLGVGYSYFIDDSLSLDVEAQAMVFTQEIQNAEGLNLNLLTRWHFINKRDWSVYMDGGIGVLVSTQDVPADGSSFNFTPQVGVGFTFALGEGARLMAGGRWYHTSNANLYEANPGRDNIMGYVGVSFPF